MNDKHKVFGAGLAKTGTTTLAACFEVLGITPHAGYRQDLKLDLARTGDCEPILQEAIKYRGFQDAPWGRQYRELDERFPGNKFILTTRLDGPTRARSVWKKHVRTGRVRGEITPEFIRKCTKSYEKHNAEVRAYFAGRPDDFMEVCWEDGDGWSRVCGFLGVPEPSVPFPHLNSSV